MIVLAIDTATKDCSACLYDADNSVVLAEQTNDIGQGHAEHLLGTIDQVLLKAGQSFDDIDKIAVCIGPGSFTGIRVGVATARSLGLALDKPVVGVSSLEAIAADSDLETPFAVVIQAGRRQAYVQGYNANKRAQHAPYIVKLDDNPGSHIEPAFSKLIGDAASLVDQSRAACLLNNATGSIKNIASLGFRSNTPPNPLYVRAADAKPAEGFALPRQSEAIK